MKMNYHWAQNEDGSITVHDVEIMGVLKSGERKDEAEVVSRDDLPKFIEVTERIERDLKRRQTYLLGHNDYKNGKAAPVIGYIEPGSRYIDGDWIKARLRVTSPAEVEKVKRGELPNRSPEFIKRGPNKGYMWALAATEGLPGHFDDRLPALLLEKIPLTNVPELATLSAEDEPAIATLQVPALTLSPVPSSPANPNANTETGMSFTKDELKAMLAENNAEIMKGVDAKLKPLAEKVATLSAEPGKDDDADPATVGKQLVEKELETLRKRDEARELDLARTKAVATLSVETVLTSGQIKNFIKDVPLNAMDYKVAELKARYARKDTRLPEDEAHAHGEVAALSKEFEDAGGEAKLGVSKNEYVGMFAGKFTEGLED